MKSMPDEIDGLPSTAHDAVTVHSAPIDEAPAVQGFDFESSALSLGDFAESLINSGFQATQLGRAIEEVKRMLQWRRPEAAVLSGINFHEKEISADCADHSCTIWLSFTSNMISSGLREVFTYLAKHKLIDVVVTSAGGVEEDIIKCLANTYVGDFELKGKDLREKGWNRIGNLIVPNDNYCHFEDWVQPLLDECLTEQSNGVHWTPSKLIDRMGAKIADEKSLLFWCHKNEIPVFCPGLTDGSLGDNLYFHSYRNPGLIIDVVEDIRRVNDIALRSHRSGIIILGGGELTKVVFTSR